MILVYIVGAGWMAWATWMWARDVVRPEAMDEDSRRVAAFLTAAACLAMALSLAVLAIEAAL